ncbi:MAG: HAMP domain-containing histidine kinase [Candidatus Eisenbacteria bacterium]|nr:HAMP domain-containing histidine kinase [Candidatus Eisenbacteria bacterium]
MKLSFGLRASLTASMIVLALLVSLIGLLVHTGLAVHATVDTACARAEAVAQQVALLAGRAASSTGGDPAAAVRRDRALVALFESALAGDPTLYDIGVFDPAGRALVHTQSERRGRPQAPRPSLDDLRRGGEPGEMVRLLGPPRTYDAVVRLGAAGAPFGEVRVGVSSALLRDQLMASLRAGAWVLGAAFLLAMLVALGLAHLLSARMRDVMTGLERLREGEFGYRLAVEGRDEMALLASSLNALGERLEATRSRAASGDLDAGELLMATDHMAAWAKVASGLAHELADPLNAAALHLGHLKRKWDGPSPEIARHLRVLEDELKRLQHIVVGFRKFALLGEMRAEWFDLKAMLLELADRAREGMSGGRSRLRVQVEEVPDRFWGDPALLRQSLSNLIANAEQAMPGGGEVVLAVRRADDGIEIEVADEGTGIAPDLQPRVFDLYFTTKEDGSGIGLAVVQQVVQLHGGRIRLRSAPGEGTSITLQLPVKAREAVHAA